MSIKVGILGATGYTGIELLRLLIEHPDITITALTSERYAGKDLSCVLPPFHKRCNLKLTKIHSREIAREASLIFCCLPHQSAMTHIPNFLKYGCKVIDLSADFRLDSESTYKEFYGRHTAPDLLKKKVYGLPELYRHEIRDAFLVANPGCYPTATILGIAPLLANDLIHPSPVICDAKSGASGAGHLPSEKNVFSEISETIRPYDVERHRHTPEMEQELSKLAKKDVKIRFTPHLIPIDRGMIATLYAKPIRKKSSKELTAIFEKYYGKEPFVRVMPPGTFPNSKDVRGTNYCDVSVFYDDRAELVCVIAAIDNLGKGASGQAVQNMNLMCGFSETTGLIGTALTP